MATKQPTTNTLQQKKQHPCLESVERHSSFGRIITKSIVLEPKEDTEDTVGNKPLNIEEEQMSPKLEPNMLIPEYQPVHKKKIWRDKSNSLETTTLITKSLLILDQASKEKVSTPFWNMHKEEMSNKLWLPTKIDSVDLDSNSLKRSFKCAQEVKSWFSIRQMIPHNKNSLMTSFRLSQYSLPESMDSEVDQLKRKSKKSIKETPKLKTLKIRLFPTKDEETQLSLLFDQSRWYYNTMVKAMSILFSNEELQSQNKFSYQDLRDKVMKKVSYTEDTEKDKITQYFTFDSERNKEPIPEWWTKEGKSTIHSRVYRGSVKKYTQNINSAISNYKAGNIKTFNLGFRSRKKDNEFANFEDKSFPAFIKRIKSHYWFRTKDRERKHTSFNDIFNSTTQKGLEIIYDKVKNQYYLHYPVEQTFFPEDDLRIENQDSYINHNERIIALDPGIRKFLVGYDPSGKALVFGKEAKYLIGEYLDENDRLQSQCKRQKQNNLKQRNLIQEMHWKIVNYLVKNYDVILYPDFRIQQMISGRQLSRRTKRFMTSFMFYQFKEKLKYKCKMYNKKLIIVDESYTSKTCTNCGVLNDTKGKEHLSCNSCNLRVDRDIAGARNIYIKNMCLR